jgi:hypothetical protein
MYKIAREIAEEAVATVRCAGYEIKPARAPFFRGDVSNLAYAITDWVEQYMQAAEPTDCGHEVRLR